MPAGTLNKDITTKKEDYSDLLHVVDQKNTPFCTSLKTGPKARNSTFDWTVDKYDDPDGLEGHVDGKDVDEYEDAHGDRAKLRNNVQEFRRTAKVSVQTQEGTDMPGAKDPLKRAVAKKLVEIKRDKEATYLGDGDAADDDGLTGSKTCRLGTWISTAGPTLFSVPEAYRPAAAQVVSTATASLDEDTDLQGILTAVFDAVGLANGSYKLLCGSTLRRRFTTMTTKREHGTDSKAALTQRNFNSGMSERKVTSTISVFEGDFGEIIVEPSSFIGWSSGAPDKDRGYLLDMDKICERPMVNTRVEKLSNNGGGERRLIRNIAGLEVGNPIGLGKFIP